MLEDYDSLAPDKFLILAHKFIPNPEFWKKGSLSQAISIIGKSKFENQMQKHDFALCQIAFQNATGSKSKRTLNQYYALNDEAEIKTANKKHSESQIGDIMSVIMREQGMQSITDMNIVQKKWPQIVGKSIGEHSKITGFSGGYLRIMAENPVWKSSILMLKPKILQELLKYKITSIKDITISLPGVEKFDRLH